MSAGGAITKGAKRENGRKRRRPGGQGELPFPVTGHGGWRPNAGRPRERDSGVSHTPRPVLAARFPLHVTLKLCDGLPSLRRKRAFATVCAALASGNARADFRVCEFSVQSNHVHLIAEADGERALSSGMNGLCVRLARRLNRRWKRRGRVFADRYHAEILRSPTQVRFALAYVLRNAARHGLAIPGVDPFSSGPWFDGWEGGDAALDEATAVVDRSPCSPPRTWLLSRGWRRHGEISCDCIPGPVAARDAAWTAAR